jgi:hypothetical protein
MAPPVAEEKDDNDKDSAHKNHQNAEKDDDIDPRGQTKLQNWNFGTWEWDTTVINVHTYM